jgi:TonB family protein
VIPQQPQVAVAANPYQQLIQPKLVQPKLVQPQPPKGVALSYLKTRTAPPPSPIAEEDIVTISEPVNPSIPISGDPFKRSPIQTLFSNGPRHTSRTSGWGKFNLKRLWRGATYGFLVIAGGMLLYGPVRSGALTVSVKEIYRVARETTQGLLHSSANHSEPILAKLPPEDRSLSYLPQGTTRIHVGTFRNADTPPEVDYFFDQPRQLELLSAVQPLPVMPQLKPTPKFSYESGVPQSLRNPPQVVSVRDSGLKPSLSLLAALEPVNITEEMSEKLLLQKIQPIYPDLAVRTGQQGTVVLQALIGKNGMVQDLKLIEGSLLLGESAFAAVRQWRYKPYFLNGRPVDAQTLVTVDFKLPAVAVATQPQR